MPRTSSMPTAYKRSSPMTDTVIEWAAQARNFAADRSGRSYPGPMNPRVRRLIVSGVLGGLVLIVVLAAAWNWLR